MGQTYATLVTLEQRYTEFVLKIANTFAYDRLLDVQPHRSSAESCSVRDRNERLQIFDFHAN